MAIHWLLDVNIYVHKGLKVKTMAILWMLWDVVKKSRQQEKHAIIKYDKIYSR